MSLRPFRIGSYDRVGWVQGVGVLHQTEVHQFLASFSISFIMSHGCGACQSIKMRNYDDFNKSAGSQLPLVRRFDLLALGVV